LEKSENLEGKVLEFNFTPYGDLTVGDMIDLFDAYGDLTQAFPVDFVINNAPPGAITPDVEQLLRYIWENPSLVAAGKAEMLAALETYGRDTYLRDIGGMEAPTGEVVVEYGLNTVTYTLPFSEVEIEVSGNTAIITGPGISDTLTDLDRLKFLDGTLALDYDGTAGSLYGLYEAAFNRTPDGPGFAYWVEQLDASLLDFGRAADLFVGSQEFQQMYGALLDDAEAFIEKLYVNILDRDPDAAGLVWWAEQYSNGTMDASDVLAGISISTENLETVANAFANGYFY
jgi:hypothetical protein